MIMYYIFDLSTNPNVVGTGFPQAYKFIKEYNPNGNRAIFELYKYKINFPDFIPDLSGIMLSGRAKLTDFISNAFGAIIVSPKGKNILERFSLCSHQFYPCNLHSRGKVYDYFWLQLISDYSDYVDYKKTTFVEFNYSERGGSIFVDSKEEMLRKKEEIKKKYEGTNWTIWGDIIVMNSDFNTELDLFIISRIDGYTYISERLYNEIVKNNLTGCELSPAEELTLSISK